MSLVLALCATTSSQRITPLCSFIYKTIYNIYLYIRIHLRFLFQTWFCTYSETQQFVSGLSAPVILMKTSSEWKREPTSWTSTCFQTESNADGHFAIDRLPKDPQVDAVHGTAQWLSCGGTGSEGRSRQINSHMQMALGNHVTSCAPSVRTCHTDQRRWW